MATKSAPSDAMFRALRSVNVDPELAFQAVEETRNAAGENVIAAISAQIADLRAEMQVGFAQLNGRIDNLSEQVNGRIDTLSEQVNGRIDTLEGKVQTVTRIVWPLAIGILGTLITTTSAFLYKVFWP